MNSQDISNIRSQEVWNIDSDADIWRAHIAEHSECAACPETDYRRCLLVHCCKTIPVSA